MEDNNEAQLREIVQRSIGYRELRYGIMRVARIFFGWPAWVLGMFAIGAGALMAGLTLVRPDHVAASDLWRALLWACVAVGGVGLVMAGLAMAVPYQFDTFMPGTESERKCLHCGHSLEPNQIFPTCEKCGSWFPLDLSTYIGRSISRFATVVNVLVMICMGLLIMGK